MSANLDSLTTRILALPRPLLLAFDVDGTLAPIVDDPAAARVPPSTVVSLRELSERSELCLALLTGRDAEQLSRMLKVPGAWCGVEHGRSVAEPHHRPAPTRITPAEREKLDSFAAWLVQHAEPRGGRSELKSGAVVLHVRELARTDRTLAEGLLEEAAEVAVKLGLSARPGRSVLECEVEPGDKAKALRAIHSASRARGVLYVGDDVTDYGAIRAAQELGGVGLFVRSEERPRTPPGAGGSLKGVPEVAVLITQLERATRQPSKRR